MTKDAPGDLPVGKDETDAADAAQRWSCALTAELAGSLRHGLNQPLAAIAANANAGLRWLGRAEPDLQEARRTLERILADVERSAALVASTRRSDDALVIERQDCSVNELIEDVVRSLSVRLARTKVFVVLDLAPRLPPLKLDRALMRQVVATLVKHAIDASAIDSERQIKVLSRGDGDAVTLEFLSFGPAGAIDLERLFDPLQSHGNRDGAIELAASRSIVTAHGGTLIGLERPEGGTRLLMSLSNPQD